MVVVMLLLLLLLLLLSRIGVVDDDDVVQAGAADAPLDGTVGSHRDHAAAAAVAAVQTRYGPLHLLLL